MIKVLTIDGVAFITPKYISVIKYPDYNDIQYSNTEIQSVVVMSDGSHISILDFSVNDVIDALIEIKKHELEQFRKAR